MGDDLTCHRAGPQLPDKGTFSAVVPCGWQGKQWKRSAPIHVSNAAMWVWRCQNHLVCRT